MPHRIRYIVEQFCIPRASISTALWKLSGIWLKYKEDILQRFLFVQHPPNDIFEDLQNAFGVLGVFTGRDISMNYTEAGDFVVVGHCRKLLEYEFEIFQMLAHLCKPCVIDGFGEDLDPWQWRFDRGSVSIVRMSIECDSLRDSESDSDELLERLVQLKIERQRH
jgi:hypothetical protein